MVGLPGSSRATTPLGVGLATLMREPSAAGRHRLLRAAYDAGFRHFDVAPSYGLGDAERVLGDFLAGGATDVTVATKVGIRARGSAGIVRAIQRPARALLRRFPGLRGRATRVVGGAVHATPDFSPAVRERSLADSLRALRRDHLDLYLLHEAHPTQLANGEVVEWLQEQKRRGVARAIGIATDRANAAAIVAAHPGIFDVVQTQSHVLAPAFGRPVGVPFLISHSVLAAPLQAARQRADLDAAWASRLSELLDEDVRTPGVLARFLVGWALMENRHGIVLLGSSKEQHLREATRAVDAFDPERLARAGEFVRATLGGGAA